MQVRDFVQKNTPVIKQSAPIHSQILLKALIKKSSDIEASTFAICNTAIFKAINANVLSRIDITNEIYAAKWRDCCLFLVVFKCIDYFF